MQLRYEFSKTDITKVKTDLLVVECQKKAGKKKVPGLLVKSDGGLILDKHLGGSLSRIIKGEEFSGECGEYKIIQTLGKIAAKNIMIIGSGEKKGFTLDTCRILGAKIAQGANEIRAKSLAGLLKPESVSGASPADRAQAIAEGMTLGLYRFEIYKDKKELEKQTLKTVTIVTKGTTRTFQTAVDKGQKIAEAINFARDLVNTPGEDVTPEKLAKEAKVIGKQKHMSVKILDEKALKKEKMNLITAVSKGSLNPPRLIHIKYKPPGKAKAKITIVGKGVTFDSGGYNLKPTRHIETMKSDMAGGAAVLAVMKLLPFLKPKVAVEGIIPASENMIDGTSHKPGDVIRSRAGKTVEIVNTDAEGRLILADAFDYALESKPDILIDLATLTGGVRYAVGELYAAVLGNNQKLIDDLIKASKEGGEPTWQLPLEKEYLKGLKEGIADLNNNGTSFAITIVGALFLHEFVEETKWAHFDIAESAWMKEENSYRHKGGTGAGVQTLVKYLMKY